MAKSLVPYKAEPALPEHPMREHWVVKQGRKIVCEASKPNANRIAELLNKARLAGN